jgi:hypothetical protein
MVYQFQAAFDNRQGKQLLKIAWLPFLTWEKGSEAVTGQLAFDSFLFDGKPGILLICRMPQRESSVNLQSFQ